MRSLVSNIPVNEYREAFKRLKAGNPQLLPKGAAVTQNNVARETGREPYQFRKERHPKLIREIQAYVELNGGKEAREQREKKGAQRKARQTLKESEESLRAQRDEAQSKLVGAHRQILRLLQEKAHLELQLARESASVTKLPE